MSSIRSNFFKLSRRARFLALFDFRTPEERGCALALYRLRFAVWQDEHARAVHAHQLWRIRATVERIREKASRPHQFELGRMA